MLPNPQDVLRLIAGANYGHLADELVEACKTGSIGEWAKSYGAPVEEFARRKMPHCRVEEARLVIAKLHGFEDWPRFAGHVDALSHPDSAVARFEAAADAIVRGDLETLRRLLREQPDLIHARSDRVHRATLLHYAAANGVENYRQETPRNIVEIANILLDAGAEIDAAADMYGGGCTTLGLAATSVHPELAGVQEPLLQTLLDRGATIDQESIAGNRQFIVTACLANGRPKAAEFLARRGAQVNLVGAAGIGWLDAVQLLFPEATEPEIKEAFHYACGYGHNLVVEYLLDQGVDIAMQDVDDQTGLHWAAMGGHPDTVRLLLDRGAPLELTNVYGGNVIGQTLWSAGHGGDPDVYIAVLDAIVGAGGKLPERHVPVNERVDAWLAERGSRAEPAWHWYGEAPLSREKEPRIGDT